MKKGHLEVTDMRACVHVLCSQAHLYTMEVNFTYHLADYP